MKRGYEQTQRAQKAIETRERVLDECERLVRTDRLDRITLASVADGAGVSMQTVIRLFGSKEGLFAAVGERIKALVDRQRGKPPAGDVAACVKQLVAHYESEGEWVWNALRQEQDVPELKKELDGARAFHRNWVEQAFPRRARDRVFVDALVVATDAYSWKLLRKDLGRSRAETESTMIRMVEAILGSEA